MPSTTSPVSTTPFVRRLSTTSSSEVSVVAKIARAPRRLHVTAPRLGLVEAYAHAPLLTARHAADHAIDGRPQPPDVLHRTLLVVEQREQLERDRRDRARGELHHRFVGGGARRHPLEITQACLERRTAVARQRRLRHDEPQPLAGVERAQASGARQPARRARQHRRARALHQAVHVRRGLVLVAHSPCGRSSHRHLRSHRARLATPRGGGASIGAEIIAYRRPPAERTAAARAVISRRSVAAARRQRSQPGGVTALTSTAPTAIPRRRSPRTSRAVSSRGSAAGRVTATTRVRAGSRSSVASSRRSRATWSRSEASSPRPTTARYLRRMARSAWTHSSAASGMASSRRAWPV